MLKKVAQGGQPSLLGFESEDWFSKSRTQTALGSAEARDANTGRRPLGTLGVRCWKEPTQSPPQVLPFTWEETEPLPAPNTRSKRLHSKPVLVHFRASLTTRTSLLENDPLFAQTASLGASRPLGQALALPVLQS